MWYRMDPAEPHSRRSSHSIDLVRARRSGVLRCVGNHPRKPDVRTPDGRTVILRQHAASNPRGARGLCLVRLRCALRERRACHPNHAQRNESQKPSHLWALTFSYLQARHTLLDRARTQMAQSAAKQRSARYSRNRQVIRPAAGSSRSTSGELQRAGREQRAEMPPCDDSPGSLHLPG